MLGIIITIGDAVRIELGIEGKAVFGNYFLGGCKLKNYGILILL